MLQKPPRLDQVLKLVLSRDIQNGGHGIAEETMANVHLLRERCRHSANFCVITREQWPTIITNTDAKSELALGTSSHLALCFPHERRPICIHFSQHFGIYV
jgi:hypothetical protein